MTTLHLGVVDVAYSDPDAKGAATTGDVAEILEGKYHVMRVFFELYEAKIEQDLINGYKGELENMLMGNVKSFHEVKTKLGKRTLSGLSVNGRIEERFRDYLMLGEWRQTSGQSVTAAEAGVNHRKKRPYVKKNKARPAFIDTGLYSASMRVWVT